MGGVGRGWRGSFGRRKKERNYETYSVAIIAEG